MFSLGRMSVLFLIGDGKPFNEEPQSVEQANAEEKTCRPTVTVLTKSFFLEWANTLGGGTKVDLQDVALSPGRSPILSIRG